jgi:catechol 2,3-dioxygenase-like lactoylglutathione lyase family enzyme
MLHHVSFNARDPERAERVLAALMDAVPMRLPAPPFPKGAWSVVCRDGQGSLIELAPWGHVLDADARGGTAHDLPADLASFGPAGLRTLEAKFRDLEFALAARATH